MNQVKDNWLPAEFRCVGDNNHTTAIYDGRFCLETDSIVIFTDVGELELLVSDRQLADIKAQIELLRNFEILEVEFYPRDYYRT